MVEGPRSPLWRTPVAVRAKLEAEFGPMFDPCPPEPTADGLTTPWRFPAFVNPPYGRGVIRPWVDKAIAESSGGLVVCLLPSYTGSPWWHDLVIPHASEIRFLRGKLRFGDGRGVAPFWSAVVIFGRGVGYASVSVLAGQNAQEPK